MEPIKAKVPVENSVGTLTQGCQLLLVLERGNFPLCCTVFVRFQPGNHLLNNALDESSRRLAGLPTA